MVAEDGEEKIEASNLAWLGRGMQSMGIGGGIRGRGDGSLGRVKRWSRLPTSPTLRPLRTSVGDKGLGGRITLLLAANRSPPGECVLPLRHCPPKGKQQMCVCVWGGFRFIGGVQSMINEALIWFYDSKRGTISPPPTLFWARERGRERERNRERERERERG